ncbi:amino acid/amide ABC transporter membrane protein 1 (HAAT family) [Chelatococcus asaccharovorans]|uniref:Amino acid/amide ABC transporter membrane protein 1 (HAAT family) n=2 Tax=Chelatococcus asaccharovorans TaxID=28210 RepID=A0A2V3UB46_9HYPH|nr:amino acid/amide ABC transporter membrane protein 1 (HAAT family) [Chelatococcus asaccharovorans]
MWIFGGRSAPGDPSETCVGRIVAWMIAQQILNGLITGSVYALFALGFTLVFSVNRVLNLAHGAVFMSAALLSYYLVMIGTPFVIAAAVATVVAGGISMVVEFVALRRLRRFSPHVMEFAALVTTLGADIVLVSLAHKLTAAQTVRFPFGTFPNQFFLLFGLRISLLQIIIVLSVACMLSFLVFYLYRTSAGLRLRAVASSDRASLLLGINPNAVYAQTFFISGIMAGIAGVLIALSFNSINAHMGESYMLKTFVIIVLGGLGSVPGCVLAALFFGVAQTLCVAYLPPGSADIILYALLFGMLLVRPAGLMGNAANISVVGRNA